MCNTTRTTVSPTRTYLLIPAGTFGQAKRVFYAVINNKYASALNLLNLFGPQLHQNNIQHINNSLERTQLRLQGYLKMWRRPPRLKHNQNKRLSSIR